VHAGEEDHTQPGLTKSNRFTRLPVEESIRMTEDRYKWKKVRPWQGCRVLIFVGL